MPQDAFHSSGYKNSGGARLLSRQNDILSLCSQVPSQDNKTALSFPRKRESSLIHCQVVTSDGISDTNVTPLWVTEWNNKHSIEIEPFTGYKHENFK